MKVSLTWCTALGVLLSLLPKTDAIGWTLLPALSVSEEYTDNFFTAENDKKEEFTTRLSPELDLTHKTHDIVFSGKYTGGVALYAHPVRENPYRHGLALDLNFPLISRFFRGVTMRITEATEYSPERPALPLGDSADTLFEVSLDRVKTFRHRASFKMDNRWSPQWVSGLTYAYATTNYEGAFFEDRIAHDITLSQTYHMAHKTRSLTTTYGLLNTDYDRSPNRRAERVSLRGKQVIGPTLSVEGGVGRSQVEEGFSVTTSDVGFSGRTSWAFMDAYYFRDIEAGDGYVTALGLNQRYIVKIVHPINTRTLVAVRVDRREQTSLSGALTNSRFTGATALLARHFSPILQGSMIYTYAQDRELGTQTESNRVAFVLRVSPLGWRL